MFVNNGNLNFFVLILHKNNYKKAYWLKYSGRLGIKPLVVGYIPSQLYSVFNMLNNIGAKII